MKHYSIAGTALNIITTPVGGFSLAGVAADSSTIQFPVIIRDFDLTGGTSRLDLPVSLHYPHRRSESCSYHSMQLG